jgi:hypothetical protein
MIGRCGDALLCNIRGLMEHVMLTMLEKLDISCSEIKFS